MKEFGSLGLAFFLHCSAEKNQRTLKTGILLNKTFEQSMILDSKSFERSFDLQNYVRRICCRNKQIYQLGNHRKLFRYGLTSYELRNVRILKILWVFSYVEYQVRTDPSTLRLRIITTACIWFSTAAVHFLFSCNKIQLKQDVCALCHCCET